MGDALALPDPAARAALQPQLDGYRALLGYAVFRPDGHLVAAGDAVTDFTDRLAPAGLRAMQLGADAVRLIRFQGTPIEVVAVPLKNPGGVLQGVLVVAQDVSFIDDRATERLVQFGFWILILTLLTVTLVVGATWLTYERPLHKLADWMRRLRTENVGEAPPSGLPSELLVSETGRLAASFRAARSTGQRLSQAAMHAEQVWTSDRLRVHAIAALGERRQLVVVSNREPYMHQMRDGKVQMISARRGPGHRARPGAAGVRRGVDRTRGRGRRSADG